MMKICEKKCFFKFFFKILKILYKGCMLVRHTLRFILLILKWFDILRRLQDYVARLAMCLNGQRFQKKWLKNDDEISSDHFFEGFTHWDIIFRNFWLQMPLGKFLYELESCSRYVTYRPNSGLSNGTKIITLGSLEKIGHAYFKNRHPQTPFASYFSIF